MARITYLTCLAAAGLLTSSVVAGCPTRRGEAPPLAPRPDPIDPLRSMNPVPGAPDPLPPGDAGTPSTAPTPGPVSLASPELRASAERLAADAGTIRGDATPPPTDAAPRPAESCDASPLDASAPTLPPVPDAPLAPDAGRPY